MVLIAAFNAIAWLRVTHAPAPGLLVVLATSASIALGEWLTASLPTANAMNELPFDAAHRKGPDFGWMCSSGSAIGPLDRLTVFVALMLAAWLGC
jgi:hypothetical protein